MTKQDTMNELLQEVLSLRCENERLRNGGCRFNCRTQKESFFAGWDAGRSDVRSAIPEGPYKEWINKKRSNNK